MKRQNEAGSRALIKGLGWFSIGLGLLELLRPRPAARMVGLHGRERLLQAYGLREIATGAGLLLAKDPTPWLWARVAGDVTDAATVALNIKDGNPAARRASWSLLLLTAATVLDGVWAVRASRRATRLSQPRYDYSARSGWPASAEDMRGRAAGELAGAEDLLTPTALRPHWLH